MASEFSFLMCSERSGSNLLARMLDAHPEVCSPPPAHLFRLLAEHRCRYGDLHDDTAWETLLQDTVDLLATSVVPWRTRWSVARLRREVRARSLGALLAHLHRAEARARGKHRLFVKENHLYRFLPLLQRTFPDLRLVILVRDPRDMALSWKNSPILRGDVVRAARVWAEDQRAAMTVLGCLEPGRDVLLVTYERLIAAPERELARICRFLELHFDPAMLAFHRQETTQRTARASDVWRNLARPVLADNAGKWRRGLSPEEIACIEAVCAEPMAFFGYTAATRPRESAETLIAHLLPRERHEKPGWRQVPAAERRIRRAREDVVRRMAARPWHTDRLLENVREAVPHA